MMRHPPDPVALCVAIRDGDPDVMERDELAGQLQRITELRAWCDAQQNRVVRRQRQLAETGRAEPPRDLLAGTGRQSGDEARAGDERERVCTTAPAFEDALAVGSVTAGHVDAVAAATRGLDAAAQAEFFSHVGSLVADAERQSVDTFQRNCRDLARLAVATTTSTGNDPEADTLDRQRRQSKVRRWTDARTGMRHTLIVLDPVRDAELWSAIDSARRSLRGAAGTGAEAWEELQVAAVMAAISAPRAPARPGAAAASARMSVLLDHHSLLDGVHANTVCEVSDGTPIPISVARRLACDAEIIPVVLNGDGRPLDVGSSARLATPAQRVALEAMYRTCGYPGCTVAFEACEVHHVIPWERGGPTDLDNLLPLCLTAGHHHQVHEGGWTLTMRPDRTITLVCPDGTVHFTGSTVDRAPVGVGVAAG